MEEVKVTEAFDLDLTDVPVCPHCGAEQCADELTEASEVSCDECGKEFCVEVEYSVTYSTTCLKAEHDWDGCKTAHHNGTSARFCNRCGAASIFIDGAWT